ncbi:hypothetical protein [Egicoccus sp. AB-alg2]|uniref:hypothetical protein n=1 Tax=Egicoccus sp. AB-alg2 TaxID=3242693 RepID=UPI00359D85F4
MILKRRTTLKWGFRVGLAVAYLADGDRGYERRREIIETLESTVGGTKAGILVDWLQAWNEGEPLPVVGDGEVEQAEEDLDEEDLADDDLGEEEYADDEEDFVDEEDLDDEEYLEDDEEAEEDESAPVAEDVDDEEADDEEPSEEFEKAEAGVA